MTRLKVGFYGGTFDPIHLGHLNLAIQMMEKHHLDEVWFCPAGQNPLKKRVLQASDLQRVEMIKLAIEHEPRFHVIETEINLPGPSYTINTLQKLIERQKLLEIATDFFVILGSDSALTFNQWLHPDQIIKCAKLLVGERQGVTPNENFQGNEELRQALLEGITPISIMEISSTTIRERLRKKLFCWHLLPAKVLDYILENHIYF